MGAAVCEHTGFCCSWQPGRVDATPECSFGKMQVFFRSCFLLYSPKPSGFSERERVLPPEITNPALFRHVFIQQTPEGCCWVSFSSWVESHCCFFPGELSHRGHTLPHRHTGIRVRRGPDCAEEVWPDLTLKQSQIKISQEYTSTDMAKGSEYYLYSSC